MIHVITTNPMYMSTIHENIENFIICHLYQKLMLPLSDGSMGYYFRIYHQDGMDLSEYDEYLNEPNMEYEFIPVPTVTTALDMITQTLCDSEVDLELDAEETEDRPDEMIVCTCGSSLDMTYKICKYLNRSLQEEESDIQTLNLFTHMHMTKIEQIANSMKMRLDTEMIYEDDPVAFSYVLYQLMNGVVL